MQMRFVRFRLLAPLVLRMWWRGVLRRLGINNTAMALADLSDRMDYVMISAKIELGTILANRLKVFSSELDADALPHGDAGEDGVQGLVDKAGGGGGEPVG